MAHLGLCLLVLRFHWARSDMHQGFQDTCSLCEQVGHPVPAQDGQLLLWGKTFDFLSISAAVYALKRGKKGKAAVGERGGAASQYALIYLGT